MYYGTYSSVPEFNAKYYNLTHMHTYIHEIGYTHRHLHKLLLYKLSEIY